MGHKIHNSYDCLDRGDEEVGGIKDAVLFSGGMMEALTGTGLGLGEEPEFRSGFVDFEVSLRYPYGYKGRELGI